MDKGCNFLEFLESLIDEAKENKWTYTSAGSSSKEKIQNAESVLKSKGYYTYLSGGFLDEEKQNYHYVINVALVPYEEYMEIRRLAYEKVIEIERENPENKDPLLFGELVMKWKSDNYGKR